MTATPETTPLDTDPVNLEAPAPRGTLSEDRQSLTERVILFLFIAIPLLAVVAAIPIAWGWGVGWLDLALLAITYVIAAGGITVGFHRLLHPRLVQGQPAAADRAGRRRVVRRSRARSSAGSPTTASTTRSPTARATRTPRGASAPPPGR